MIDHSDIIAIEKRMKECAREMRLMSSEVAMAITVLDYDSDRRKNLLARYAKKYIDDGHSSAAAETLARADPAFDAEYQTHLGQNQIAQEIRKKFEDWDRSWETARSLLARQRETLKKFPEE